MKKLNFALFLGLLSLMVSTQKDEWKNPEQNEVNRLPMRAHYFPYENMELAQKKRAYRFVQLSDIEWKMEIFLGKRF